MYVNNDEWVDTNTALEQAGYKAEFEYGSHGGYDWSLTWVYSRGGRVFTLSANGCSCNSFSDNWSSIDDAIGDMYEVPNVPSLVDLYKEVTESYYSWDDEPESIHRQYQELFRELRASSSN
jgi:hypothetical protein